MSTLQAIRKLSPVDAPRMTFRKKSALLSDSLDAQGAGLMSLAFFVLAYVTIDPNGPTNAVSWTAYYLSFVVNWPHFAMSYQMLYRRLPRAMKQPAFLWAALACPVILLGALTAIFMRRDMVTLSYAIQAMFFFVGWHYSKQTFGISLVLAHLKNYRLDAPYKRALKLNLLALWIMNWALLNMTLSAHDYYGFSYTQLGLPSFVKPLVIAMYVASALVLGAHVVRHWLKTGEWPPRAAAFAVLAMTLWYVPAFYHAAYFFFIPFFHSLQYILFVTTYRREKVHAENLHLQPEHARQKTLSRHALFFGGSCVLGYLFFEFIPAGLDKMYHQPEFQSGRFFMAAFLLFINIHHYFIDNVIWRQGFGDMQKHLVNEAAA